LINDEYNGIIVEEFDTPEEVASFLQKRTEYETFYPVNDPSGLQSANTFCVLKGRACTIKRTVEVL
jgi:hypothetical protein